MERKEKEELRARVSRGGPGLLSAGERVSIARNSTIRNCRSASPPPKRTTLGLRSRHNEMKHERVMRSGSDRARQLSGGLVLVKGVCVIRSSYRRAHLRRGRLPRQSSNSRMSLNIP